MKFINRKEELRLLEKEYARNRFSFVVIYGRRRVGKTRLIQEFMRDKQGLYFLADTQTEKLNMMRLQSRAAHWLEDSFLRKAEFQDWYDLLEYIVQVGTRKSEKFVLAIDEFQYLVQVNPAIVTVLQRFIDEVMQNTRCMLILCGSIISLMYKNTLAYSSPLYGRRTAQLKLMPLDYENFCAFYPRLNDIHRIQLYALLSGIPKYIELFENDPDIFAAIRQNFLDQGSFYYQEPRFLLGEEVSENKTYFSILQVIARGEHQLGKIASRIGLENRNITSFLNKLRDMEIVVRQVPVFEKNPEKSKKGLYFIKDHFLRFWFSYIFTYSNELEMGHIDYVLTRIRESFAEFCAPVFEQICLEKINKHSRFPVLKIGKHWERQMEIDVVAIGEEDILFGECKWTNKKVGVRVYSGLKEKVSKLNPACYSGKNVHLALFAKSGFTDEMLKLAKKEGIYLYSFV